MKIQVSPGTTTVSEDSPVTFSTVQLYVPTMSLQWTDGSMVSTVWRIPSTASTTILVCWWVALRVITIPFFLQVTVVAGPPVELQVRVLDWSSKVKLVTMGEPAWI